MTDITYSYDSTAGGNYGKGKRTGMSDALGTSAYKFDTRGRLVEEKRTVDTVDYITGFAYDGADRYTSVTYPTSGQVTMQYPGRGLTSYVTGGGSGVYIGASYNKLSQYNYITFGNGLATYFGYWDVGGAYDTTGGYYGRLWKMKTLWQYTTMAAYTYAWDAGGNLTQRDNLHYSETESFSYDFLDRLTGVSGPYTES